VSVDPPLYRPYLAVLPLKKLLYGHCVALILGLVKGIKVRDTISWEGREEFAAERTLQPVRRNELSEDRLAAEKGYGMSEIA
jgi:hypothetical protein